MASSPGGELVVPADHGRRMIVAASIGNDIAAYCSSERHGSVGRRDTEAARFLALVRANRYTPPREIGRERFPDRARRAKQPGKDQ